MQDKFSTLHLGAWIFLISCRTPKYYLHGCVDSMDSSPDKVHAACEEMYFPCHLKLGTFLSTFQDQICNLYHHKQLLPTCSPCKMSFFSDSVLGLCAGQQSIHSGKYSLLPANKLLQLMAVAPVLYAFANEHLHLTCGAIPRMLDALR